MHFKEQHPEKFYCEFCYEIFLTVGSLIQHISKIHQEIKLKVKERNFKSDSTQSNSEKDMQSDLPSPTPSLLLQPENRKQCILHGCGAATLKST